MNKVEKAILVILGIIVLAGVIFFAVDYNKKLQNETNQNTIKNEELEMKGLKLEDLPKDYTLEQAVKDECFVIAHNKIYNKNVLENFISNTGINAKDRKEDTIRIVQFTTEGDPIITEVSFKLKGETYTLGNEEVQKTNYIVKIDNTRDKFSNENDRKVTTYDDFPGEVYGITEIEKDNIVEIRLALYAEICYVSPDANIYKDYFICSYSKSATIEELASFYATVLESNSNIMIVRPYENEEEFKTADKIMIGRGKYSDEIYPIGTNVKITYNGIIMETYPAQIIATKIEIKSADSFELLFYDKQPETNKKVHTILINSETDKYNYNIYAYDGNVNIRIDGNDFSLRDALLNNKITMDEIIQKANKDIKNPIMYKDGGSIEYHYTNYTIIKMHKLDGNRDVYIGGPNMTINDI